MVMVLRRGRGGWVGGVVFLLFFFSFRVGGSSNKGKHFFCSRGGEGRDEYMVWEKCDMGGRWGGVFLPHLGFFGGGERGENLAAA